MQTIINNGDSGLNSRNAINANFTEIYGALVIPTRIQNVNSNTQFAVIANTFIEYIAFSTISGNPVVRVGTTPNGFEISSDINPGNFNLISLQQYFQVSTILYFTISGGAVNARVGLINNFY